MNKALKAWAERALVASGAARVPRRRFRQRSVVLAYHNIVPVRQTIRGDLSLHLHQDDFARQLDALLESHDVIPLDQLFQTTITSPRSRAVITFDDAYEGTLTAGVEELLKRGMPATIFVAPALLGRSTWWDKLAEPGSGVVPLEVRSHAIDTLGGHSEAILARATSKAISLPSESTLPRIGTESELLGIATKPGITLGSHSWSHQNLCRLSPTELETELARPLKWLASRDVTALPWLSYPYGRFNSTVEIAAKKAGYHAAVGIDGGWVPRFQSLSFAIPRLNIPSGLSVDGFRLRLAGFGVGR